MPQKLDNPPQDWDKIPEDECKHVALNCPLIITFEDETLTVIFTCLKWTFNYDFWIQVKVHPEGNWQISKQVDLDDHHLLLRSLSDALNLYEAFPEPNLNSSQLEILKALIEYLGRKFGWNIIAANDLALPWPGRLQVLWHWFWSRSWIFHTTNRSKN